MPNPASAGEGIRVAEGREVGVRLPCLVISEAIGLDIMDLNSSHDVSSPTAKGASSGGMYPNPTAAPDPTPPNSFRLAPDPL